MVGRGEEVLDLFAEEILVVDRLVINGTGVAITYLGDATYAITNCLEDRTHIVITCLRNGTSYDLTCLFDTGRVSPSILGRSGYVKYT